MTENKMQVEINTISQKKKTLLNSDQIQNALNDAKLKITQAERSGHYIQAQSYKKSIQQLKKDLTESKLKQAISKHKKEKKELEQNHQKQISKCKGFWEEKKLLLTNQGISTKRQAQNKHKQQIIKLQEELQLELSKTFKESSECLNFKKIEENMAKQKNYAQAHKIHQIIQKLQIKEKDCFMKQKKVKIELAKQSLIQKQQKQAQAIEKKMKTALFQLGKDQKAELQKLKHKQQNNLKALKSQQQKQLLELKGQFKSKIGLTSSSSRSRLLTVRK